MDQLNSMLTRLKRGLYIRGNSSQPTEKQQPFTNSSHNGGTDEDDGFVLIGHGDCKETTVYASIPEKMVVQKNSQIQGDGPDVDRTGRPFSMFSTCDHISMDCAVAADLHDHMQGIAFHPAVTGVPFQLNPILQEKGRLQTILSQLDLKTAQFDWQKYYYDFDVEQTSLQELYAMEDRAKPKGSWMGRSFLCGDQT